jgi:hypothetical protein
VGLRAGLDTEAIGKILSPLPEIEPRSPGRPARSGHYTGRATRLTTGKLPLTYAAQAEINTYI